jgi:HK97 family phage portal protein
MSMEDAQFIEQRKFSRSEIAMFFGVPPHMIGDLEKSTSWGTGVEQQSIGFLQYTLMPWLVSDSQAMQRDLLTAEEERELYFHHNVDGLLRGDFKSRQEGLAIQRRNGVINADEWREMEDMNPREDGGGAEYIIERNMTDGSDAGRQEEPQR